MIHVIEIQNAAPVAGTEHRLPTRYKHIGAPTLAQYITLKAGQGVEVAEYVPPDPGPDPDNQKLGGYVQSGGVWTREVVAMTAQEVTDRLEAVKTQACDDIDRAAVALDDRITTVGGHQSLEYHLRANQLRAWDDEVAAGGTPHIDETVPWETYTILGQDYTVPNDPQNDPPRYRWGLLRCYVKGFLAEHAAYNPTQADALNRIRYERDLWFYILDLRADNRLGEVGKSAVHRANTAEDARTARDIAVERLNAIK